MTQGAVVSTRDHFPVVVHTLVLRAGVAPPVVVGNLPPDTEVLLLRRAGTNYGDGLYQPPGGYVTAGESPSAAARRECKEEADIVIAAADLLPVCVMPYGSPGGQGVDFIMMAWRYDGVARLGEPHKADHIGWFPVAQLPSGAVPFLASALACLQAGNWYHEFGFAP